MKRDILMYLLMFMLGIFLFVILQQQIMTLDTSSWNFTGHAEAAVALPVVPWLFLIILIAAPCYRIFKEGI